MALANEPLDLFLREPLGQRLLRRRRLCSHRSCPPSFNSTTEPRLEASDRILPLARVLWTAHREHDGPLQHRFGLAAICIRGPRSAWVLSIDERFDFRELGLNLRHQRLRLGRLEFIDRVSEHRTP